MKSLVVILVLASSFAWSMDSEKETCAICLSPLTSEAYIQLACNHDYHSECFACWEEQEQMRIATFTSLNDQMPEAVQMKIPPVSCPACHKPKVIVSNKAPIPPAPIDDDYEDYDDTSESGSSSSGSEDLPPLVQRNSSSQTIIMQRLSSCLSQAPTAIGD